MNPEAQEEFNRITSMTIAEMTAEDRAFLRARRDYLNDAQRVDFKSVLAENPDPEPEVYVSAKDKAKEDK